MVQLIVEGNEFEIVERKRSSNRMVLVVNGRTVDAEVLEISLIDSSILVQVGSRVLLCKTLLRRDIVTVEVNDRSLRISAVKSYHAERGASRWETASIGALTVEAPMAGRIVEVKAVPGQEAREGEPLVVLEAMKMENEIAAPKSGRVREVHVKVGSLVKQGDKLVVIN